MDPFQIKFHDFWTNTNPETHISELPDFRKIGPYSSGDHFSESCAPRKMMQNRIDEIFWGQTFKNTPYFNLRASGSWTWDLGTRILVPGSWYQDLGTKILVARTQRSLKWNKRCFWKFGPRIFRLYRSASFFEARNFRKNAFPTDKDLFSGNLQVQIYELGDF